jgi:hypothetical protein
MRKNTQMNYSIPPLSVPTQLPRRHEPVQLTAKGQLPRAESELRGLLRPGNYIALLNHAKPGAAGLSREAVFYVPEQRARLSESVSKAEHKHTRVRLMNEVYEVILLISAEGVTNNRHLAM